MRVRFVLAGLLFCVARAPAMALDFSDDLSVTGYADLRVLAPPSQASWLRGGLGKYRYGRGDGNLVAAEGVLQVEGRFAPGLSGVAVLRAEPRTPGVVDALETYLRYAAPAEGPLSWSMKAGAFFPSISLENDDLGWASPYTLTPSAINSWIGDELRTMGAEASVHWRTPLGTWSLVSALMCCNDEAGILMADRGWSLNDRPTGLFERVRLPDATQVLFHQPTHATTGMFDEIDGRPGWYAGLDWQMAGVGKVSVLHYDNQADPGARSSRDTAWDTRFWSLGARTQLGPVLLISQGMVGQTVFWPRPTIVSDTKFRSAFLLASYDIADWRFSLRGEVFDTRHVAAAPHPLSEDGDAVTASVSWFGYDWMRLTTEISAMHSRRGEYVLAGLGSPKRGDTLIQLDSRFFF